MRIDKIVHYLLDARNYQRIAIGISKGGAMMSARRLNLAVPSTWEFSGFSQNGEDGILDILRKQLLSQNRYFIEIGAADGVENNSAWLVIAEKYSGLMVEGNARLASAARRNVMGYSIGTEVLNCFVTLESIESVIFHARYHDPDVFSLDIDGNDYYIAKALLERGLRPKIIVVEYNSAFGPERSATIKYSHKFVMSKHDEDQLYYGVSITGWRKLFLSFGYRFITVERNGVNAFFVDPAYFDPKFLNEIGGIEFGENQYQLRRYRVPNTEQFSYIEKYPLVDI